MRTRKRLRTFTPSWPSPMEFFGHLRWIDGRPLVDTIERYRARIFEEALYSFNDDGSPRYTMALTGRAKKNFKSCDLVLAAFYRLLIWPTAAQGNDGFCVASDEGQAADDLSLAKALIRVNKVLADECQVTRKQITRRDGRGSLTILPGQDVLGSHGKTYAFLGIDELHTARDWSLLEALSPDPTRDDTLQWITSYDSLEHREGQPLFDLLKQAKRGEDDSLFFSWYSGTFTTDREHDRRSETAEQRANPSMATFRRSYLTQQKRRLPSHRYRRLHLNEGGQPEGCAFSADAVHACVVSGRKSIKPKPGRRYVAFCDPSGGSSDDFTLGIAHRHKGKVVLDLVKSQHKRPKFDPRIAVRLHAKTLKSYGITTVWGDRYAGETFKADFESHGIRYRTSPMTAGELYEAFEVILNAADECELLDVSKLTEQLCELVWRGRRIDHVPGSHDDFANSAVGSLVMAARRSTRQADWNLYSAEEVGVPELMPDPMSHDPRWKILNDPHWN